MRRPPRRRAIDAGLTVVRARPARSSWRRARVDESAPRGAGVGLHFLENCLGIPEISKKTSRSSPLLGKEKKSSIIPEERVAGAVI